MTETLAARAQAILHDWVQSESLRKHCYAVADSMKHFAQLRGEDAQEICAVVDHEKLKHGWLWEMVGAKIHKGVDQFTMFGEEDLPPKRKPQIVANPEFLIEIPEPVA